ncbi:tRNA pseudouridine(38-40) synthase TruA [Poseidonibacter ostreae]|jgi:tRNA pseudouridine38-40 synthase|uniref:tRNA pseudouridine synthase A n=1 Tax=Poseidonibacter ostreae TaxID=2654171 RepID=A0A6L4WSS4_9BACT|nr:tRNA pseudouridine(38-40) synthase TruA [Poseidonibacter ostreae]KAB7886686.1 tRNA pseudouridine(38-40) synthase TruA [Poseidonibacter ostreae]KAB7889078.1 tRNA pseudouridine(38-40) synthase TruA [Poseidonibacter ostreae]KAB7891783.1 tRNA pseudouridine(38-40) synthase TruA [Poseidonibacter ostreae]MAC84002.1 tRNA pseudouridine(38-40) synthase TruA [Arcobacter sp.]|tara:strand:+ start:2412 stop:3134 length:723 start_codon:yes stop_codon:yes gene_type:complete
MNLKFLISYDGSLYKGSQKQPNNQTVEDKLLKAFKRINIETKIILSGRTDKDVHATGQVFNCIIPDFWTDFAKLKATLNQQLPSSIRIHHIKKVADDFHSRFHAKKRVYRYLVTTKNITAFNNNFITQVRNIDEKKIKEAIKEFIGVHDFEYFHKQGSDKDITIREVYDTKFYKYKDIYIFKFTANSYLRSQIRLMVGFLLKISEGKLSIEDLKTQLRKEKNIHRLPALANGLYLAKVIY